MDNFREIKNDILKEWLEYREDFLGTLTEEDKKNFIYFEEIEQKILHSIPKAYRKYVQRQLKQLDYNFYDYSKYWNEKYYRNGFVDGVQLLGGSFKQ